MIEPETTNASFLDLVCKYSVLKSEEDILKTKFKKQLAEIEDKKSALETQILKNLDDQGLITAKTQYGTVSKGVSTNITIANVEEFYNFVIEHKAVDLLQKRISSTVFEEYVNDYIDVFQRDNADTVEAYKQRCYDSLQKNLDVPKNQQSTIVEKWTKEYLREIAMTNAVKGVAFNMSQKLNFKKLI